MKYAKWLKDGNFKLFNDKEGKSPATLADMMKEYDKDGNFQYKLIKEQKNETNIT